MSKATPTIQKFMTATPHSIGIEQPLSRAHAMMREHGIRHLPVLHGGKLQGILTERDLQLVESLVGVDPTKEKVEDAMSTVVYSVSPDAPLDERGRHDGRAQVRIRGRHAERESRWHLHDRGRLPRFRRAAPDASYQRIEPRR